RSMINWVAGLVVEGVVATKFTVAGLPLVIGCPLTVAVKVTVPDRELVISTVAWPLASVVTVSGVVNAVRAADAPVTKNDTVALGTGLPLASTICAWTTSCVVPSGGEVGTSTTSWVAGLVVDGVVAT